MKLTFTEELTGWDVRGAGVIEDYLLARIEETEDDGWVVTELFDYCTLEQLDQIRHKLANLEQARLCKLALQEKKDGND